MSGGWTAVVPIKPPALRKTRLSGAFAADDIVFLTEWMLAHVMAVLDRAPGVCEVLVLSQHAPEPWRDRWWPDHGAPMNAALRSLAAARTQRLVVLHADLPQLCVEDVEILIERAQGGVAIAPDCAGQGTNALALADAREATFAFGSGSFSRHRRRYPAATIVRRTGLACDVDFPRDVDNALQAGALPPWLVPDLTGGALRDAAVAR